MDATDDLITVGEAADLLGVSSKTVRRWADAGHLTVVRTPGNQRRLRRSETRALLQPVEPVGDPAA